MEYTIEITQYCENRCIYCSTNATDKGKHLPIEEVIIFLEKNTVNSNDRINISGGEPLAHPDFYKVLQLCLSKTRNVWVYTNALKQIKYNAHVLTDGISIEANICLFPGCFEIPIKIPEGIKVNLLKFIPSGRGRSIKEIPIHVSGNMRGDCSNCHHVLLQADGQVVQSPCKKNYQNKEGE